MSLWLLAKPHDGVREIEREFQFDLNPVRVSYFDPFGS